MADNIQQQTTWHDYLEMCKPKVVLLLLLTGVVGMFLAMPVDARTSLLPPWDILILGTIGIAFASGGAAVVNHIVDRRIDILMARTTSRPIPQGKIEPKKAIIFAASLSILSMIILGIFVNMLTAWLTLFGLVGYAFIYTMYLKRVTPQNIVIGGLSGALPPLLGWTAVTNQIDANGLLLVLIIYVWTPPHFWALAIHRRDDYAKAEVPMLPVTHGIDFTKTQIIYYTILLLLAALLPFLTGLFGIIYLIGSSLLGLWFFYYTIKLKFFPDKKTAMKTFGVSISYLMFLFLVMLVDHYFKF